MRRFNGTQQAWVKAQLISGRSLTHPDLIEICGGCGGWRLGAIIHKLRADGWPIHSTAIAGGCEANPPVKYSIPAGWRPNGPAQLGLPL